MQTFLEFAFLQLQISCRLHWLRIALWLICNQLYFFSQKQKFRKLIKTLPKLSINFYWVNISLTLFCFFRFVIHIIIEQIKLQIMIEDQKMKHQISASDAGNSEAIPSFLLKTYQILENQKYADIISWTKNGEGFIVKKVKDFAENILPIHFRHSNYTSFVRQLNMYDFHKTRQENQENAFKNSMFKKGFKHLLKDIQRKDYKKNKENNKEVPASNEKNLNESKSYDHSKFEKNNTFVNELQKNNLVQLLQKTQIMEKKALILAEMRRIFEKQQQIISFVDILFELQKLNKICYEKYANFNKNYITSFSKNPLSQKTAECPQTTSKTIENGRIQMKQQGLATSQTLFSSFCKE